MFVTLWYPIGETSNELVHAADARRKLSIKELHSLLTLGSQIRLPIPHAENKHPGVQTDGFVAAWDDEGAELRLHKVLAGYVVTRQSDPLNRLHVTHPNIEMLREFCLESLDIEIPKLILARAAEIDQT
jgi:hypothetical protein